MIRVVSLASLVALMVLVVYLPSAFPPEYFLGQVRIEHELNYRLWGGEHATRIMDRALVMQSGSQSASPIASSVAAERPSSSVDRALADQLSQAGVRLFSNPYFRSVEALLTLSIYRLSSLLEWLPMLAVFIGAALIDGLIRRRVKSKEFILHSPEAFGLHGSLLVLMCCATILAFVIPATLHPLLLACVLVAIGAFASLAIANFHARG